MAEVKETREALVGLLEVACVLAERLRDGADVGDAMAVWAKLQSDSEFALKLSTAYQGVGAVPAELGDLTTGELVELVTTVLSYLPKLVAALKKA